LAIVQAWQLFLFGRIVRMPDETDAMKIITASPWILEHTTGMQLYYMDEDYPAGTEIQ